MLVKALDQRLLLENQKQIRPASIIRIKTDAKISLLCLSSVNQLTNTMTGYLIEHIQLLYHMNRSCQLLLLTLLCWLSSPAFVSPTWSSNIEMVSGEQKAINSYTGPGVTANTVLASTQTFATAFSTTPRVVLSMLGYRQGNTCPFCELGFKVVTYNVSSINFRFDVTVYAATITMLFYNYMGVAFTATDYTIESRHTVFSSGNLTVPGTGGRTHTMLLPNLPGETYTNYATNRIRHLMFLSGFRMNVGTTGTYINLTARVVNDSFHQVSIGTIDDVRISEVGYFRLSFDQDKVMAGYLYLADIYQMEGVNNLQLPYVSTGTASSFQFRNFMMGFNRIHINTTSVGTDIMNLATGGTWQTFWTSAIRLPVPVPVNATFAYLHTDIFHLRKRTCPAGKDFFNYVDELCYDLCPVRMFSVSTPAQYCQKCHFSCLTCSAKTSTTCLTCSATDFRQQSSSTCPCMPGYWQPGVSVCSPCHADCLTCNTTATECLTCNSSRHLVLDSPSSSCRCSPLYFNTTVNGSTLCTLCAANCLTCQDSAQFCTSCRSADNMELNATTNRCQCVVEFYMNNNGSCMPCSGLGCRNCIWNVSTNGQTCLACRTVMNFELNATTQECQCLSSFSLNTISRLCDPCARQCLTCQTNAPSSCLSCPSTRRLVTTSCVCKTGFIQQQPVQSECTPAARICGNGILQPPLEQCDDFNVASGDGCSAACDIEQDHQCTTFANMNGTSKCYYSRPLDLSISSIIKIVNGNKISVMLVVLAPNCNMENLKKYLDSLVAVELLGGGRRMLAGGQVIYISSAQFTISSSTPFSGYLQLLFEYTSSISTLQNKQLVFIGSGQEQSQNAKTYFYATPSSTIQLQDPDNKVPMVFFPPDSYSSVSYLSYIYLGILALGLLFLVAAVVVRRTAIAVENLLVYQFAYFCILGQKEVELAVASLGLFGKYSLGANFNLVGTTILAGDMGLQGCNKMAKIYQTCSSLNNINVTFMLGIACFCVALGLTIYKSRKQSLLNSLRTDSAFNSNRNSESLSNSYSSRDESSVEEPSNTPLAYQMPHKLQTLMHVCLQLGYSIFFLFAVEYLLAALNQEQEGLVPSVVWLGVVGVFMLAAWVLFFLYYALPVSYAEVVKQPIQKVSLHKMFYLLLFVYCIVWGVMVSVAPGIVAYCLLMVLGVVWGYLAVKNAYKASVHKVRCLVNQLLLILISAMYIVLEFVVDDGLGLGYSVAICVLLLLALVNNVGFTAVELVQARRNERMLEKVTQDEKQNINELQNYMSQKQLKHSTSFEIRELREDKVRFKMTELKTFREEIKITSLGEDRKQAEVIKAEAADMKQIEQCDGL